MALPEDLRALIEALPEPTLLVSGTRVSLANEAATQLLGRGLEGSDVRLAIRQPDALELILAGREAERDIAGIGAPDRPWTIQVRPIADDGLLIRLIDRSSARAAEKMRVDFVANASHELRTPLTTILGYAETLAEDGDLDSETHARFGAIIRSEAQRMLRIVEDLMALSRIEADRFVPPRERIDLGELVGAACEHVRTLAEEHGARIEIDVEKDLPQVRADRGQIMQLLENLIANSARYGCSGADCLISVSAQADGHWLLLSVRDNGEGIARQHLPRLTERFYRVDEARSRDSGGTGLGLAIVKHIVERHRGLLDIRSAPGQGTEVLVRLPVGGSSLS